MADALVKVLNKLGYQPVFLPRSGVSPPELYVYANKRLTRRGPLADYLPTEVNLPKPIRGRLADIEHKHTSAKRQQEAISFLGQALRCIGIDSPPKLELSFVGGNDFSFAFTDVSFEALNPSTLDTKVFARLNTGAIPEEQIETGKLHIVYEYAYAKTILMRRADSMAFKNQVTLANIHDFLNLGTSGEAKVENETTISFRNTAGRPAAFAYKAGQIKRRDGSWEFFPEEVVTHGFFGDEDGVAPETRPFLPARGVVLAVND
jgi:hypothetical protein